MKYTVATFVAAAMCVLLANTPAAISAPTLQNLTIGGSDVLQIAKKKKNRKPTVWHKTRRGEGELLGRVGEVEPVRKGKKYRNARNGDVLIGRVPSRNRKANNEALNQFVRGMAEGFVEGMLPGSGAGRSRGCGIDVSTPNPRSCGNRYTDSGGNNGLRPPYQCPVNGRIITTNTFRAGCWMVSQNNTRIPMR